MSYDSAFTDRVSARRRRGRGTAAPRCKGWSSGRKPRVPLDRAKRRGSEVAPPAFCDASDISPADSRRRFERERNGRKGTRSNGGRRRGSNTPRAAPLRKAARKRRGKTFSLRRNRERIRKRAPPPGRATSQRASFQAGRHEGGRGRRVPKVVLTDWRRRGQKFSEDYKTNREPIQTRR